MYEKSDFVVKFFTKKNKKNGKKNEPILYMLDY